MLPAPRPVAVLLLGGAACAALAAGGWTFSAGAEPASLLAVGLGSALLTSLAAQHRTVPVQNLCAMVILLAALGALLHAGLGAATRSWVSVLAIPDARPSPTFTSPGWTALFWPAAVLSARGAAAWLLAGQRERPDYGFRLLGLAALLTGISLAVWLISHPGLGATGSVEWPFLAGLGLPGGILFALLSLAVCTPWLISKQTRLVKPGFAGFVAWILLVATGAAAAWRGPRGP